MSPRIKSIIQYVIIVAVTGALIWFSLSGLQVEGNENKWQYLARTWNAADKIWLLAMAAVTLLSHFLRAIRWRILLSPVGYRPTLVHSFLSLMVGYLVNLVIPRGGEVSRCYNLYKLDETPVEVSFGTVVVERIVDLVCLVSLIVLSFLMESGKLLAFIESLPVGGPSGGSRWITLGTLLILFAVVIAVAYRVIRRNARFSAFVAKTWEGFRGGFMSLFHLKNKWPFIFYSIAIWALYFGMSYCVVQAFPATRALGVSAVMSLFAIGAIAMAVPTPGGAGSYHLMVPQGLVFLYNIPRSDAVAFTFIFHGWQTLILIVAGAVSLVATSILVKKYSGSVKP